MAVFPLRLSADTAFEDVAQATPERIFTVGWQMKCLSRFQREAEDGQLQRRVGKLTHRRLKKESAADRNPASKDRPDHSLRCSCAPHRQLGRSHTA